MVNDNDEFRQNKEFIDELICENIWLHFENNRLRKSLKELKRLERWWKGEGVEETGREGEKSRDNRAAE